MKRALILYAVVLAGPLFTGLVSALGIPTQSTRNFLNNRPAAKAKFSGTRLVALYGTALEANNTAAATDDFVASFVTQNKDAFGVDQVVLEFKDSITISQGSKKVYRYTQKIEGLLVEGSMVRIVVHLGSGEKVAYVGVTLTPHPSAALPPDLLTEGQALAVVDNSPLYPQITSFSTTTKVIYEEPNGKLHRAWRFAGWGSGTRYLFFVDTNSGTIAGAFDQILDGDVSGTVTGFGTPCCTADNPNNPASCPQVMDMPGIEVSIDGGSITYANGSGDYGFTGLTNGVPVTLRTRLVGKWVTVDHDPGTELTPTPAQQTVTPMSSPITNVDFAFNPAGATCSASGSDTAQVNAFVAVQESHDWFKALAPNLSGLDQRVVATVNIDGLCAAQYEIGSSPPTLKFSAPCPTFWDCAPLPGQNHAFSTIVSHEYGHFVQEVIGITLPPYGQDDQLGFLEGTADTFAALLWDDPCFARDHCGTGECRRDAESVLSLGDRCIIHNCGQMISGAFWDTRKRLIISEGSEPAAKAIIDPLFANFLLLTQGYLDQRVLLEVLTADDNDGDFSNGTPHAVQIVYGFGLHGWTLDQGVVNVKWIKPGPVDQPGEPGDYTVDTQIDPPLVTLKTTIKDGNRIVRWIVGRVAESISPPIPLSLMIQTAWASEEQDIVVQVGDDDDPNYGCASLGAIDIRREGPWLWSGIELHLGADLGSARCETNSAGDGGRMSGTVVGALAPLEMVEAAAIGTGAAGGGTLQMSFLEGDTKLDAHPLLSKLVALGSSESSGDITVTDPAGILGDITISGTYSGTLCATNLNLAPPAPIVPSNISVVFGPGGKICNDPPECLTSCFTACSTAVSPAAPETVPVSKNRYISFTPPSDIGGPAAIRVRLVSLHDPIPPNLPQNPPPDFAAFEGEVRWVGRPGTFLESQETPGLGTLKGARLQCSPYYQDWSSAGLIHVTGAEIVPSSIYEIQIVRQNDYCGSPVLEVKTARSGDIAAQFNPPSTTTQPDAIDVTQLVNKFKNVVGAPSKAIAQLQPNLPELNADISALDIVAVVDAVKQFAYAYSGPCPCPSAVSCGSTACTVPSVCVAAFGAASTCVKTCNGGDNAGEPCINNTHCTGGTCGAGLCRDRCARCAP